MQNQKGGYFMRLTELESGIPSSEAFRESTRVFIRCTHGGSQQLEAFRTGTAHCRNAVRASAGNGGKDAEGGCGYFGDIAVIYFTFGEKNYQPTEKGNQ